MIDSNNSFTNTIKRQNHSNPTTTKNRRQKPGLIKTQANQDLNKIMKVSKLKDDNHEKKNHIKEETQEEYAKNNKRSERKNLL